MKKSILLIAVFLFSCDNGNKKATSSTKVEATQLLVQKQGFDVNVSSSVNVAVVKYVYDALSYRDPFLPISGEKIAKAKLTSDKEALIPSLGSLQLKGFVVDVKDKIALFSSPYGRYLLINGKLYDSQNRLVKGFSGKIVYDSQTSKPKGVVLVTEENDYKEYILSDAE